MMAICCLSLLPSPAGNLFAHILGSAEYHLASSVHGDFWDAS